MYKRGAAYRCEELEDLESYDNLISHIEYLHKFHDFSMINEDINGYTQLTF